MPTDNQRQEIEKMKSDLDEILRRVDFLPNIDSRSADEIVGYDEDGLLN